MINFSPSIDNNKNGRQQMTFFFYYQGQVFHLSTKSTSYKKNNKLCNLSPISSALYIQYSQDEDLYQYMVKFTIFR